MNFCSIAGCDETASVVYFGMSLCPDCLDAAYDCPYEGAERTTATIERYIFARRDIDGEINRVVLDAMDAGDDE